MDALKPGQSYRCKQCGNKTRFVVTQTVHSRYFHHQIIGGGLKPEDESTEVLKHTVNAVICVHCNNGNNVEIVMEGLVTE